MGRSINGFSNIHSKIESKALGKYAFLLAKKRIRRELLQKLENIREFFLLAKSPVPISNL